MIVSAWNLLALSNKANSRREEISKIGKCLFCCVDGMKKKREGLATAKSAEPHYVSQFSISSNDHAVTGSISCQIL